MQSLDSLQSCAKSLGARCSECPLNGSKPVLGYHPKHLHNDTVRTQLIIVAESPGPNEVMQGEPLVGQAGFLLRRSLGRFGVELKDCIKTNAILCRPERKLSPSEWKKALDCCKPRLLKELQPYERGHKVILALGARALQTLTGKAKITPWMGAPLQAKLGEVAWTVLPSIHPAAAIHKPAFNSVLRIFLGRAIQYVQRPIPAWLWPNIAISGRETTEQQLEILKEMLNERLPVGVDVETAGLDPIYDKLLCIGIVSSRHGVVVDTSVLDNFLALREAVGRILSDASIEKVMHNGQHDVLSLESNGFEVRGFTFDTMLAHAIVAPELPHDLGFVATCEFTAPRWKSEFRVEGANEKGSDAFTRRDKLQLYEYNSRDSYITAILYKSLQRRINDTHRGQELYNTIHRLGDVAMRMRRSGILIDTSRFDTHRARLAGIMHEQSASFNRLTSGKYTLGKAGQHSDLKRLYFGEFGLKPLSYSEETGEPKLDVNALQEYLVIGTPEIRAVTEAILGFRKASKLVSTYIDGLPIAQDGRVHSAWKVHGTVTSRWSSGAPNLQNVPMSMRDLLVAAPGKMIVGADFSALEARIAALLAKDAELLQWYANGADSHRRHAAFIFGVDEGAVSKQMRQAAKKTCFALLYQASDDVTVLWKALRLDFPDITMQQVKRIRARYFEIRAPLLVWQKQQIAGAQRDGFVEEILSGRRTYFHDGNADPNKSLNHPIQGMAGTLTNRAILKIADSIDWKTTRIAAQIHDAIYLECENVEEGKELLESCMTQELEINDAKVKFTVEVGSGPNMKEQEKN